MSLCNPRVAETLPRPWDTAPDMTVDSRGGQPIAFDLLTLPAFSDSPSPLSPPSPPWSLTHAAWNALMHALWGNTPPPQPEATAAPARNSAGGAASWVLNVDWGAVELARARGKAGVAVRIVAEAAAEFPPPPPACARPRPRARPPRTPLPHTRGCGRRRHRSGRLRWRTTTAAGAVDSSGTTASLAGRAG